MTAARNLETVEPEAVHFRRTDARRNHERVFAAALEIFGERGLQATVPQVAERAGVGKATVYRSYPTRDDLVEAVVRHRFAVYEQSQGARVPTADAYAEFKGQVLALMHALAGDRLLADVLADPQSPAAATLLERLSTAMEAAKESGKIRSDADVRDLRTMLCGPVLQLMRISEQEPARWQRYGELFLQAIRP
ncbi:TetR/AcrR family transcriptional regulator [Actinacidiphila sp. bgisy167]|uniref:TetR/AcrR family transcriptional regulator n=1 Tax=Actinacidiphila sp. bgisy167 TaxID=3413797 RepID=UPI003D72836D